jgi:hypothetical protein
VPQFLRRRQRNQLHLLCKGKMSIQNGKQKWISALRRSSSKEKRTGFLAKSRSKQNITCSDSAGGFNWIFSFSNPNLSPAQQVRFGKTAQRSERMTFFYSTGIKERRKRHDACDELAQKEGFEPSRRFLDTLLP